MTIGNQYTAAQRRAWKVLGPYWVAYERPLADAAWSLANRYPHLCEWTQGVRHRKYRLTDDGLAEQRRLKEHEQ